MGSETTPASLNQSQLRAVSAMLRLVEEAIEQIEQLLTAHATRITYRWVEDLGPEDRRAIHTACGHLRATLVKACHRLGVEIGDRSQRREIRGKIVTLWAMLGDTKSEALRGYGPLSPHAAKDVDEVLEEIARGLTGILNLIG